MTGSALQQSLAQVRELSADLCTPLAVEDYGLQAMPEASPAKWHLAHTTWFFETFILRRFDQAYRAHHPQFAVLFNSYYHGVGEQFPRARRGQLSRPTVAEVMAYRQAVTAAVLALLDTPTPQLEALVELGIHHEQQHQELFFTDLKYNFFCNPLFPAYANEAAAPPPAPAQPLVWQPYRGGDVETGHRGDGFCFDNETPAHAVLLQDFALGNRLVSNAEYLEFIDDGGYRRPQLWLADGWARAVEQQWQAPLYWVQREGQWFEFTLYGLRALDPLQPVSHVCAYEADAYCRWAGARLPSEFEWEYAARHGPLAGQFLQDGHYHPNSTADGELHGTLWQWTSSAYAPYPGYRPTAGAVGEYNGKFMVNQLVLRGGSCVSSASHIRSSYRNFFYPADRWQFSGIRMARSR